MSSGSHVFRKTARNLNPPTAFCGNVCMVEIAEIVLIGSVDPHGIHLQGKCVTGLIWKSAA